MVSDTIVIKGRRYYYYDTYTSWEKARKIARSKKRLNKRNQHFIQIEEKGGILPYRDYNLYMTKVRRFTLANIHKTIIRKK